MSLISVFDPVPTRVRALTRLVATSGPMSRSDLQACFVLAGDGKQFGNLIRETIRLGLLTDNGGQVRLSPGIGAKDVLDDESFVALTNRELIEKPLPNDNDNYPVAFALAWLLSRRPGFELEWRGEHKPQMEEDMEGEDVYDVTNADRAAMLAFWACFLGYATALSVPGKSFVVPDPTEAIARYLGRIFNREKKFTIATFFSRLSKICPILEGGTVRNQVEARLRQKRTAKTLSSSTSLALLRLEQRKIVKLDEESDADVHLLDLMHDNPRRVSHLSLSGRQL